MTMSEQLPATVESVALARRAVRRFAAGLDVDVDGMTLAVSEAVANVVAHAYDEDAVGVIELSGERVAVRSRDRRARSRPRTRGRRAPSHGAGFGIEIIRRLAQHVALEDSTSGVALTMRFRRGGAWSAR